MPGPPRRLAVPHPIPAHPAQELTARWRRASAGQWEPREEASTSYPYIERTLRRADQARYAAAGLLPYCTDLESGGSVHLLMGRAGETPRQRGRPHQLVLLGGKREIGDGASAVATALREAAEETDGLLAAPSLRPEAVGPVLWFPNGKYAVFLVRVPPPALQGLPARYAARVAASGLPAAKREVAALQWMPAAQAMAAAQRGDDGEMHFFSRSVLRAQPLQLFFDALLASVPPPPLPAAAPVPSSRGEGGDAAAADEGADRAERGDDARRFVAALQQQLAKELLDEHRPRL